MEKAVFSNLGARRSSVLVEPGHGLDNAVVSLGGRRVLLVTSDPLSVIPAVGMEASAWLSVHLLASDLATSGVAPQFAMLDLNLPPEMGLSAAESYLKAVGEECKKLGIAIVGGHTGSYPGSGYTVVGGGMMFSIAKEGEYMTPAMAKPGDAVVMTKGAAIGATAVLSASFPKSLAEKIGAPLLRKAKSRLRDCSTVRDALAAADVGLHDSVTSMHDATEGGVLGGLSELSSACAHPVLIDRERIHVPEEAAAVCDAFGLDPLVTLSEGTLLVTCKRKATEKVQAALAKAGIESYEIGRIGQGLNKAGLWVSTKGSSPVATVPAADRYWDAFSDATSRGLG